MKVIKISALWCPGCLIMNGITNSICEEYNFEMIELDYDFDEDKVKQYNVGSVLPVIIFQKDEKEVLRIIGEKSHDYIKEQLEEIL